MAWYMIHPPPVRPWPSTPADAATPPPVVAEASAEQAAVLDGIRESDALAVLAGVDAGVLAKVKEQEWHERH